MLQSPSSSLQGRNLAGPKAIDGHLPRCGQFVVVNLDPGLYQPSLPAWQAAVEGLTGRDGEHGFIASGHRVDVQRVMRPDV